MRPFKRQRGFEYLSTVNFENMLEHQILAVPHTGDRLGAWCIRRDAERQIDAPEAKERTQPLIARKVQIVEIVEIVGRYRRGRLLVLGLRCGPDVGPGLSVGQEALIDAFNV